MTMPITACERMAMICLLALGCDNATAVAKSVAPIRTKAPIEVEVAVATRRDIARTISLPVQLFPWQRTDIVAKVTGYIKTVLIDRGSRVRQNDVLATVWDPELAVELSHQKAEVKAAEGEVTAAIARAELHKLVSTRFTALIPDRAATQTQADVEQATYKVTVAEAEKAKATVVALHEKVRQTETLLDYTTVRAPFDGVVTERFVHEGAFVEMAKGTLLFHMVQSQVMRATIDVPEADSPSVSEGTPVRVQFSELGPKWTDLTIVRSAQALDVKTRTMRVEADLRNPDGRFQPGMYGQAIVVLQKRQNAVTVPSNAILREGGDSVLVIRNGVATRVPITIGLSDDKFVEVLSGIGPDVRVIAPVRGVAEGAPVTAKAAQP